MQAVSGSGKVESVANYPLIPGYGDAFIKQMSVFIDMAKEVGLEIASNNPNFNVNFRPQYADSPGDFDGVTTRFRPAGGIYDPVEVAVYEFIPNAGNGYSGFFTEGGTWKSGDPPNTTTLLKKARSEFDEKKRIALARDFQRMEAERQYQPSFPGTASGLLLAWPALRNVSVFRDAGNIGTATGDGALSRVNLWLEPGAATQQGLAVGRARESDTALEEPSPVRSHCGAAASLSLVHVATDAGRRCSAPTLCRGEGVGRQTSTRAIAINHSPTRDPEADASRTSRNWAPHNGTTDVWFALNASGR